MLSFDVEILSFLEDWSKQ